MQNNNSQKNTAQENQSQKANPFGPGTKAYSILLGILLVMDVWTISMALAVAPGNPDVVGFLFSQSIFLIVSAVMLFFQIRFWIRTGSGPNLRGKLAKLSGWFRSMLFPVRTHFRPVAEPSKNAQKMTARFRNSLEGVYQSHQDPEEVTQMFGNLLRLHSLRLQALKLDLHTSYEAFSVKGLRDVLVQQIPDGKLNHFTVQEHLKEKRILASGSRKVYESKGNVDAACDLVGARNGGGEAAGHKFICPNCGSVHTMTELIHGCPYCGTAFLMEELRDRVSSFSTASSPEMDEAYFHLRLNQIINRIAFAFTVLELVFGFFPMMYEVFILDHAGMEEMPAAIVLSTMSLVLLFFAALALNWVITIPIRAAAHHIYQKRREKNSLEHQVMVKNRNCLEKIRAADPEFSMESFFSNVRNKIAAIHYSTKAEQADVFALTDLSGAVQQYKDVAECVFGPMELTRYSIGGVYKEASVDTWLTLLRWDGSRITTSAEKLHVELRRARKESRENPFGVHVPTCSRCGGSVDLLKGSKCPYCGTDLNFMSLDWCITKYSQVDDVTQTS